ncbi:MAG: hypothetical protein ACRDPC_12600 [Solirubrobacteraceae bacterium]
MKTSFPPEAPIESSLYEALGEPTPATVAAGETSLTATKETLDADTEDVSDDDILNL